MFSNAVSIEESLDIAETPQVPVVQEESKVPAAIVSSEDIAQAEEDFVKVRKNIKNLLDKGTESFDTLQILADSSQSAGHYEVLTTLLKTLTESNMNLLDLHAKKKKLKEGSTDTTPKNVNNNFFLGSTKELQDLISKKNEEILIEEED